MKRSIVCVWGLWSINATHAGGVAAGDDSVRLRTAVHRLALLELVAGEGLIEDLLLDQGVDAELGADFLDQRLLALLVARFLEFLEQLLDLAVVGLEQGDGIHFLLARHVPLLWVGSALLTPRRGRPLLLNLAASRGESDLLRRRRRPHVLALHQSRHLDGAIVAIASVALDLRA